MRTGEAVREWKKFLFLFACLSLSVNRRNCFHFIKCILVVCPAVLLNQGAITTQQLPAFVCRGCQREKEREEIYHNGFDWVWECVSFAMPIEMLLFHWIVKTIPKLVCCFTFLCVDFSFSLFFFCSNDEGTWVYRWSTFDGQIIKIIFFVYSFFSGKICERYELMTSLYTVNYLYDCTVYTDESWSQGSISVFRWCNSIYRIIMVLIWFEAVLFAWISFNVCLGAPCNILRMCGATCL